MHDRSNEHALVGILENNDRLAEENRQHFDDMGAYVVNFMSAPGAGKTTLVLATAKKFRKKVSTCVIEGDMVGDLDAERLRSEGIPAYQISTGRSCHLDAGMVARLLHSEAPPTAEAILVENVGNLVCPAEFSLGENLRIVLLSVTEGDDKPIKYPVIFRKCDAVVLTKEDLLPHVDFNCRQVSKAVAALNPHATIFSLSAKTESGMAEWLSWLESKVAQYRLSAESSQLAPVSEDKMRQSGSWGM